MGNAIKQLRGQVRQIVKEILPEVLAQEIFLVMKDEQIARLQEIARMVNDRMQQIEDRSKDMQSLFMRELANKTAPRTTTLENPLDVDQKQ